MAAHQAPLSLGFSRQKHWSVFAISFSNAWKVKVKSLSCVWLFATPWTAAHQAPPSMGFLRQEYWFVVSLPNPLAAAAAKSLQLCQTLCSPIDGSPPSFPIPGILQARTLEWVTISFSKAWKWKVKVKLKSLSRVQLLATPWIAAYQAPPSMGFLRQEYWIVVSLPNPLRYLHINTSNKAHFLGRLYKIILRFVLLCCILLCWGPHIMSRVPSRPPDLTLEKSVCRSGSNS